MIRFRLTIAIILSINVLFSCAIRPEKIPGISLNDTWKFKTGDSIIYADPQFNDTSWANIPPGTMFSKIDLSEYNGFAWYRYKINIPHDMKTYPGAKKLVFYLGKINDCDQLFLNGTLIGGNNYYSDDYANMGKPAGGLPRMYEVPIDDTLIHWNKENTIAIRVLNVAGDGGMSSTPYITTSRNQTSNKYALASSWKFALGDSIPYSSSDFNDETWTQMLTGRSWESQGFNYCDGYGWYRSQFSLNERIIKEANVNNGEINIYMGKIDDNDQVYINGVLLGENNSVVDGRLSHGSLKEQKTHASLDRVYKININDKKFRWAAKNIIAVRVFDSGGGGGIYGDPFFKTSSSEEKIKIDDTKLYKINNENRLDTFLTLYNTDTLNSFHGFIQYEQTTASKKEPIVETINVYIKSNDSTRIGISLPMSTEEMNFNYSLIDSNTSIIYYSTFKIPFVLVKG